VGGALKGLLEYKNYLIISIEDRLGKPERRLCILNSKQGGGAYINATLDTLLKNPERNKNLRLIL